MLRLSVVIVLFFQHELISPKAVPSNVDFKIVNPEIHTLCSNLKAMLTQNQRVESTRLSLGERQLYAHDACLSLAARTLIERMESVMLGFAVWEFREYKNRYFYGIKLFFKIYKV